MPVAVPGDPPRFPPLVPPALCEVVITADDPEWLTGFTRSLVEDRLVACGQVVTSVRSTYRWEGAVEQATEARVALHTRVELVAAIVERVTRSHPYDVPCVLALPILGGNPDYLAWVERETREPDPSSA
ncbi:MAG: divalent-cation tolerance protein CutA [Acidimicrobiales bacterium]